MTLKRHRLCYQQYSITTELKIKNNQYCKIYYYGASKPQTNLFKQHQMPINKLQTNRRCAKWVLHLP